MNQGVELDAVLDRTLQLLADQLHFDAYLATRSEARDGLYRVVAQRGLPPNMCADIAKQEAYEVLRQACVSEKSIVFPDLREAALLLSRYSALRYGDEGHEPSIRSEVERWIRGSTA